MNPLGSDKEIARNKLLILFIMDKLGEADDSVLTAVFSETRMMNYFIMKHMVEELVESGLIKKTSQQEHTVCQITSDGRNMLVLLDGMIPKGSKKTLERQLVRYKNGTPTSTIYADFTVKGNNEYCVTYGASERDFKIIEITMAVGTREHAKAICENWKTHSPAIYSEITESLFKKRNDS